MRIFQLIYSCYCGYSDIHVFLLTNKTFEDIRLALAGTFLQRELLIFSVFETIWKKISFIITLFCMYEYVR